MLCLRKTPHVVAFHSGSPSHLADVAAAALEHRAHVFALEGLQQLLLGFLEGEVLVEGQRSLLLLAAQARGQVLGQESPRPRRR